MSRDERTARQVILPEVGPEGQLRIESRKAQVPQSLDAEALDVFRRYVRGAGQTAGEELVDPRPELLGLTRPFLHPQSRSVATGALAALFSIKAALEDQ